jgi:putative endonuclease
MAEHNVLGKLGEELAGAFLTERGYAILHRNWRHGRYQIDIIVLKGKVLHFVEVKTRASNVYGFPEENVTKKKIRHLLLAADEFLHPDYHHIQFDVLAINKWAISPPNTSSMKTFSYNPQTCKPVNKQPNPWTLIPAPGPSASPPS